MEKITFIDIEEVSKIALVKPKTVYSWVETDRIPHVKLNGAVRFIKEDILRWIESCKRGYNVDAQTSRCPEKGGKR